MLKRTKDSPMAGRRPDEGQARPPPRWAAASRRARSLVARPALVRFEKPVVSFTFDDFPKSAVRFGAPLLESVGGRGTFYAAAAFAGLETQYGAMFDGEDVARLRSAGHEIGCRTLNHMDATEGRTDDVIADMVRNADALAALGLEERLVSFAYPFGAVTTELKKTMPTRFTSARASEAGMAHGRVDLAQLPSNPLYGEDAQKRGLKLLEDARRRNGWLIFHAHDVGMRPTPWGATTATLERLVMSASVSDVEILTVGEVAARLAAAGA